MQFFLPEDFGMVSEEVITVPPKTTAQRPNQEYKPTAVTVGHPQLKQAHNSEQQDKNNVLSLNDASQAETHHNYCSREFTVPASVTKSLKAMC